MKAKVKRKKLSPDNDRKRLKHAYVASYAGNRLNGHPNFRANWGRYSHAFNQGSLKIVGKSLSGQQDFAKAKIRISERAAGRNWL